MQELFNAVADDSLLIDLAISFAGLSFMCMLVYAMRWLPVNASRHEEHAGTNKGAYARS